MSYSIYYEGVISVRFSIIIELKIPYEGKCKEDKSKTGIFMVLITYSTLYFQ